MILTDPAIQRKFSRRLRVRALADFLQQACEAAKVKGEVSVLLTGDAQIRRLNRQFRGKNKPTDVLSFPAPEVQSEVVAGDLAISVETAARQATEPGHALAIELQVLILHGVLHLAGYDHETDSGQMARREALLRRRLGLEAGLIERTHRAKPARATSTRAGSSRR